METHKNSPKHICPECGAWRTDRACYYCTKKYFNDKNSVGKMIDEIEWLNCQLEYFKTNPKKEKAWKQWMKKKWALM